MWKLIHQPLLFNYIIDIWKLILVEIQIFQFITISSILHFRKSLQFIILLFIDVGVSVHKLLSLTLCICI